MIVTPSSDPGAQYRHSCYSDIHVLYYWRGWKHEPVPYIHGDGVLENEIDPEDRTGRSRIEIGDLEYPIGSGLLVAAAALFSQGAVKFFTLSALILALCGFGTALLLTRMAADQRRIAYFALAPSLVLYAFHNWDLAAVVLMCGSLYAFSHRRDGVAAVLAGVGAATKVFPVVLVAAFMFVRWREDRMRALRIAGWSAAAFVAINVPFALVNPQGWWFPWKFQSTRPPNTDSTWFMIYRRFFEGSLDGYARASTILSGLLFVGGALVLLRAESRRAALRPYALSFGLVVLFLLTGKVFSPQYALWLLPFFVLLDVPWYGFAAFAVTEAAVWFAISAYFLATGDQEFRLTLTEIAVWARFASLAWLLWWSRRARELVTTS